MVTFLHSSSGSCPSIIKFDLQRSRQINPFPHQAHLLMPRRLPALLVSCSAQRLDNHGDVDVLIAGGGIAGMAMALSLHRLGIKSRVLEQSPNLRVQGAALAVWTNGWHALEALGVADSLRQNYAQLTGLQFYTKDEKCIADLKFSSGTNRVELRGVDRRVLLETLANALPSGIVAYDSRVSKVHKAEGNYPQLELKNGSTLQTKVLVGCDGIGSVVAQDLGFKEAHYAGYMAIRGLATFPDGHNFPRALKQVLGCGVRLGCLPMDSNRLYWFLVFNHSPGTKIEDPNLVKEEALQLVSGLSDSVQDIIKRSQPETLSRAAISDRWLWPWSLSKVHRHGVTVAGDALHPVTPNLAQGGCSALEDGVLLGRMLSNAFKSQAGKNLSIDDEMKGIGRTLDEYAIQRQKRMFSVAVQANFMGKALQSESMLTRAFRDALLPRVLTVDTFTEHSLYNVGALA